HHGRRGDFIRSDSLSFAARTSATEISGIDLLDHRGKEPIARVHARQGSQKFSSNQGIKVIPYEISEALEFKQQFSHVRYTEIFFLAQYFLNHLLVFFCFERARGINDSRAPAYPPIAC